MPQTDFMDNKIVQNIIQKNKVSSSMIYLIDCKNFCKWYIVPPAQQLKKLKQQTLNKIKK
jgi:hypothetical protein